ncbi:MAG: bifunctional UDP-N-acetylmuramoyl-tripeptide:D-alanyl-D-alanine ligase/alanine racemase [Marinilabiliaceae bacterium]|nr:bifunctional UDP-N-acetylmuramoyl-tripeptide:D-alanyl-D-alanine ligase/alanine racemase [Marinilabiliaceae bacterium]
MNINIQEIAKACHGRISGVNANLDAHVRNILTDSRNMFDADGCLFVAIKGERHDGENYIGDLYDKGVRLFLTTNSVEQTQEITRRWADATFIIVDNVLQSLQMIASWHRRQNKARILSIIGSNGKTIVKEWLSQIVGDDIPSVRSPRSYNSQLGVALSLLLIKPETQLGIIEAGISQPNEMERLRAMVMPEDVIWTNIGDAHQENFDSLSQKTSEKRNMCENAQRIFYRKDDILLDRALSQFTDEHEYITWGKSSDATFIVSLSIDTDKGLIADIKSEKYINGGNLHIVNTHITDEALGHDLIHALTYAIVSGIDPDNAANRASELRPLSMRLEQKEGCNGCTIINDSYNADVTSLAIALDMLHQLGNKNGLTRTLILSDLLQSRRHQEELYADVEKIIRQKQVTRLIGIGKNISQFMRGRFDNARFFASTEDFLNSMSTADFRGEAILLKGSRIFGFERIADHLEMHRNRTRMEINLDAVAHNVAYFRRKLKPGTKILAMVKAFSYGTGSFEIARHLQAQGVDILGVAFADEGHELRLSGIQLPIIVMNPEAHSYEMMLRDNLEPEMSTHESIIAYNAEAERLGISRAPIHIKVNTGMTRSGFDVFEMPMVARTMSLSPRLRVNSAFSHLVGSDEPKHDEFTKQQISLFETATTVLKKTLGYPFDRHILNSAGIERFTEHQMEIVRLGIGLYGISAIDCSNLRNVATLKSYISQVRSVPAGTTVGYGRKTTLERESRIAVVPIGYADGLDRRLSNGVGRVSISGVEAPIAGNVCMDICMVDVTDIENVAVGDEVTLFGDEHPVWEMSERIGTICYEVLTGIGRRVKRVYVSEN